MSLRSYHYRMKRLTRWLKQIQEEFPFITEFEKEVAKGLALMTKNGICWHMSFGRDGIEAVFFVFMTGLSGKYKDHQYFYGRIRLSNFTLWLTTQARIKGIIKEEAWDIICEMLALIKEYYEDGEITGKIWEPTEPSLEPLNRQALSESNLS